MDAVLLVEDEAAMHVDSPTNQRPINLQWGSVGAGSRFASFSTVADCDVDGPWKIFAPSCDALPCLATLALMSQTVDVALALESYQA